MSPPASTASLLLYIAGSRLFDARPAIRFSLAAISGPGARRVLRVAACRAQRIPYRNPSHLVPPKAEWSTSGHAPQQGEPLSHRVHWPERPDRREPRHEQLWERLL